MLFGIYPGEKQTIQYVLGTISILANSIISNVFVRPENRQHHSAN
jgi:DNA-binding protein